MRLSTVTKDNKLIRNVIQVYICLSVIQVSYDWGSSVKIIRKNHAKEILETLFARIENLLITYVNIQKCGLLVVQISSLLLELK